MKSIPRNYLIMAVGLLAFCLVLSALRHQVNHPTHKPRVADTDTDSSEKRTRITLATNKGARVTALSRNNDSTSRASVAQRVRSEDWKEDFDAQKRRAFGDAVIFGQVFGEKGPLAGASVALYEDDPMTSDPALREAVTDQQGTFTLEKINDKDVRFIVVAKATGYAPEARYVQMTGGANSVYFRLRPGVSLKGVVRDKETSLPIAGATVYYPGQDTVFGLLGNVRTGQAGQFVFPDAPSGAVKMLAEAQGYRRTIAPARAPNDNAEIAMVAGGAIIKGVALSRNGRKPVAGAKITAHMQGFSTSVASAEDGTFEFHDMPEGTFFIRGIKGMPSQEQKVVLTRSEVKEGIEIIMPSELIVSGRVIVVGDETPVRGVRIFYQSPTGRASVLSDEQGLFGFETLALDHYTMELHEKGYLPVIDSKTTGAVETIRRKIDPSAASDDVTIRLKPVPSITGIVKTSNKKNLVPVFGADVAVTYQQGDIIERVMTRTDTTGNFFVNLPSKQRGQAKVVAKRRGQVAVASTRAPTRRPLEMILKQDGVFGELLLVDKSPLAGVKVSLSYLFPDNRPADKAMRIEGESTYASFRGRFFLATATGQKVELMFNLPDGQNIPKIYDTDAIVGKQLFFIYDPVSKDVLSNAQANSRTSSSGGDRGRQHQGGGQNKPQPQQNNKPAAQPQPQKKQ